MTHRQATSQRGVTMTEVLVTVAITGVMLAAGMTYFGDIGVNARLREGGNGLLTEAMAAQSEAIRRNSVVRLAVSGSTVEVIDVNNGPTTLRKRDLGKDISVSTAALNFGSTGVLVGGLAQQVNITMVGTTCGTELRCPALKVEAGGGIKLCANHAVTSC